MKKKAKIRILYIGPVPPEVGGQAYGGIATHLWELATYAHKNGYDVYILANTSSSFVKDGIKIIGSLQGNKLSKAFKSLKFGLTLDKSRTEFLKFLSFKERLVVLYEAYQLKQILETIKSDIIHVHSLHNDYNLALKILQPSIPIIITDHGAYWGIKKGKDLIKVKHALSIASKVICVSSHVKEKLKQIMRSLNLDYGTKLHVIHNPIDINKMPLLDREELRKMGRKKIVFFLGVYEPIRTKRLDLLLKAFTVSSYLRHNCKLVILTKGEGIHYAKEYISRYNIDGIVLNPRPRNEVFEYYTVADVFVMPSTFEAFGIAYVEALLTGAPVVGYYKTIKVLERLLDIYIGEGFDPSREGAKELAEKIEKVLNTEFNRELLRKKVIENLSWDKKFREFDMIYREVLFNTNTNEYSTVTR